MDMPLSEIKEISQVEAKVLYLEKSVSPKRAE
jgi:hypothetical protein